MTRQDDPQTDQAAAIRASGLFDADWYRAQYRDVDMVGMDPALHYLRIGAHLARDPGPAFSTDFYYDTHPDAERAGANPLLHHLDALKRTGAPPKPARRNILWAAARLAARNPEQALSLAETALPANLHHALQILRANAAGEDDAAWLAHLNRYLAHFGAAPVRLKPEGPTRFHRLACDALPGIETGPCISVIMPAWNAEATLAAAARSILDQTWRPLELIIVDDASTDDTWREMQALAAADTRVKLMRNGCNTGPYVSKNLALSQATGTYVTGHDADDWAHPERLESHIRLARDAEAGPFRASLGYMLRMTPEGHFSHIDKIRDFSPDGVRRIASTSCLFEAQFLKDRLGHWDSVRFGADSEMIARTEIVLGAEFARFPLLGMICLDVESCLTNDPEHGIRTDQGFSPSRSFYCDQWRAWHATMSPATAYLDFPQQQRRFAAPEAAAVPACDIEQLLAASSADAV